MDKTVVRLLEPETGKIGASVVSTRKKSKPQRRIRESVSVGTEIHTDALKYYVGLESEYEHKVVDRAEGCVNGNVHTNRLENFWSLPKRSIKGAYKSVETFHLFRCLDEQSFRYNERKAKTAQRFQRCSTL